MTSLNRTLVYAQLRSSLRPKQRDSLMSQRENSTRIATLRQCPLNSTLSPLQSTAMFDHTEIQANN
jgi:hypothetical protein